MSVGSGGTKQPYPLHEREVFRSKISSVCVCISLRFTTCIFQRFCHYLMLWRQQISCQSIFKMVKNLRPAFLHVLYFSLSHDCFKTNSRHSTGLFLWRSDLCSLFHVLNLCEKAKIWNPHLPRRFEYWHLSRLIFCRCFGLILTNSDPADARRPVVLK